LYRQAIFRIAQGLLNNVLKHAQASHAWVDLNMENGSLTLRVADDGIGFDATQTPRHGRGLAIIRQRVEALGGHWTWRARPNGGSTCLVSIPVQF
jgi:signal transduction histidine kinase